MIVLPISLRFSVIVCLLLSSAPAAQHGSTTDVNPYTSPEHEQSGARLFRSQCAGCHGPDGTGTAAGPSLTSGVFAHGGSDGELFRTVSKGLDGTAMTAFASSGLQIWELVTHIRALNVARGGSQSRGDAQAGNAVFQANCAGCHTAGGNGGFSGPDLTGVGARRSYAEISDAIRNADRQVPSQYWSVAITTSKGETLRGFRLNEDTFSLQIRDEKGRLRSFRKQSLQEVKLIRQSPMPAYSGTLSDRQIEDVIAWLISVGGRQ